MLFRFLLVLLCLTALPRQALAAAVPITHTQIEQTTHKKPKKLAARRVPCVLLAFFLPPLAVFIWQDKVITAWFWWAFVLMFLFWLPGVLYAIFVISK